MSALSPLEIHGLVEAEAVIQAGLQTTWRVAQAFAEIHAGRLYRATHDTFEAYCAERWGISRAQGNRMVSAGVVLAELAAADVSPTGDNLRESHLRELARATKGTRAEVYTEAVAAASGEPTAGVIREAVEARRSAFDDPGALAAFRASGGPGPDGDRPDTEDEDEGPGEAPMVVDRTGNVGRMAISEESTDDWHTPDRILDLGRAILGNFDTDPASCRAAQDRVRASRWYGQVEDGLVLPWPGRVWLNPPFSNIDAWVDGAKERVGGDTEVVLLCCHANTDAKWWHRLTECPVAFSRGRVRYLRPDGELGASPPRGTALVLIGGDRQQRRRFVTVLEEAGWNVRAPIGWRP